MNKEKLFRLDSISFLFLFQVDGRKWIDIDGPFFEHVNKLKFLLRMYFRNNVFRNDKCIITIFLRTFSTTSFQQPRYSIFTTAAENFGWSSININFIQICLLSYQIIFENVVQGEQVEYWNGVFIQNFGRLI